METVLARKMWRTLEPYHGMIYFAPEATAAYEALGVKGFDGYFASRAAPMGAVPAEVVIATFFNFNPDVVRHAIPAAWAAASPAELLDARLRGADAALRHALGEGLDDPGVARAAELARIAATGCTTAGRPLYAGHAGLPWPDDPHLALWHAISLLREFRGDGHIALLVAHGLSGIDALLTHGASGEVPSGLLRSTRGWGEDPWDAAIVSMRSRGWLTDSHELTFTDWGAAQRRDIEDGTDRLAAAPYLALGDEGCAELRSLVRPWSKAFAEVLFR
jgi:hypothetical protein